ncbi:SDR family oxidoreductase [Vibrio cyclitrophicus]|uniref:SDR family oxidoreductase n=1 Tax=Vibrio cyclitrophicus TaxID=47951 RepID=UPI000C865212|nr:SDR family oxidoreductase [Vibrio cyclitrophicus]PMH77109.1 NAD-dependent dehydratase [Vibrio cyclitrophicus]
MENSKKILVAGATGYLGRHIIDALKVTGKDFFALARSSEKLKKSGLSDNQIRIAEVTKPRSLIGCCDDIDIVISCVGITRQQDGLTYMDVDFQANENLLEEAIRAGVKKFVYISALNAPQFSNVRLLHAKEKFSDKLLNTEQLTPCVIRPNGFFSDLEEYYKMAQSGRAYVFGNGSTRLNPIHGTDLAHFCLEAIDKNERELSVGGPETLSVAQIAMLAFEAQDRTSHSKIINLPDWVRRTALLIARALPERLGGPTEFFLTVSARDMIAPPYGEKTLAEHFRNIYHSAK